MNPPPGARTRPVRIVLHVLGLAVLLAAGACVHQPKPDWLLEPRPETARARRPVSPWQAIGHSVEGRPIRYRTVGGGPRQVLWIGGIHGNEVEGTVATASLPAAILEERLIHAVTLHIVEDMNPDGRAENRRTNTQGVDLNRDFPASNRRAGAGLSQPESRAIHDLVLRLQPDLVIVAHSWGGRYFINYDGPGQAMARLFRANSNFPVVPSTSIAATPGSMGSWCGWDLRIPILTLEWLRGTDPEAAWRSTRRAILAVIRGE